MQTKTLVIAVVLIAATAALAIAPLATIAPSAMAAKGGVNPGGSTTTTCTHNGNGEQTDGACSNPSGTTSTTTCVKVKGKFTCTTS